MKWPLTMTQKASGAVTPGSRSWASSRAGVARITGRRRRASIVSPPTVSPSAPTRSSVDDRLDPPAESAPRRRCAAQEGEGRIDEGGVEARIGDPRRGRPGRRAPGSRARSRRRARPSPRPRRCSAPPAAAARSAAPTAVPCRQIDLVAAARPPCGRSSLSNGEVVGGRGCPGRGGPSTSTHQAERAVVGPQRPAPAVAHVAEVESARLRPGQPVHRADACADSRCAAWLPDRTRWLPLSIVMPSSASK